jgi:hydrogenase nickel incorporation protein HypA/HybF
MHEVSLMRNLLDIVARAAENEGGGTVSTIHVRLGELSGVNEAALRFAFDVLSRGTVAEGGTLECETVPFEARCRSCGAEFHPPELTFFCPSCDSPEIDVKQGREMEVDYICMDDESDRDVKAQSERGAEREGYPDA